MIRRSFLPTARAAASVESSGGSAARAARGA